MSFVQNHRNNSDEVLGLLNSTGKREGQNTVDYLCLYPFIIMLFNVIEINSLSFLNFFPILENCQSEKKAFITIQKSHVIPFGPLYTLAKVII